MAAVRFALHLLNAWLSMNCFPFCPSSCPVSLDYLSCAYEPVSEAKLAGLVAGSFQSAKECCDSTGSVLCEVLAAVDIGIFIQNISSCEGLSRACDEVVLQLQSLCAQPLNGAIYWYSTVIYTIVQ